MSTDLALPDAPFTLPDGSTLTVAQHRAAYLRATTELSLARIATEADYANKTTVGKFLNTDKGKLGVQVLVKQRLSDAGRVGLNAMIRLAKSARSENVRQLAAADLMDRAGIRMDGVSGPADTGRELNININLGDADATRVQPNGSQGEVIEHE